MSNKPDEGVARVRRRHCSNDNGDIGTENAAKGRQRNDEGPNGLRNTFTFSSCRERNDGMGGVPGERHRPYFQTVRIQGYLVESAEQGHIRITPCVPLSSSNPTPR
jgi:hypothetical protein